MKQARERIDHGTWSHAGKQDIHCSACREGIGSRVIPLKPMEAAPQKKKEDSR